MPPFTIITLVTGCTLIVMSTITLLYPPKNINTGYGYRTKASMRNRQTWEEANRYSSKLMLLFGIALATIGLLSYFVSLLSRTGIITATTLTFLFSLLPIPLTERRLKKLFDKEGNRKADWPAAATDQDYPVNWSGIDWSYTCVKALCLPRQVGAASNGVIPETLG